MRYALISAFILCAIAAQAFPQNSAKRKIPCQTAENAASCYWTRGRLNLYNGNPSYRIWKVGTKRILGVYSGPSRFPPKTSQDSENPEWPANIDKVFDPSENWIFADFEICPLDAERKGEMQDVCIEAAKHILVQGDAPGSK
jgi:hypothetical protein